MLLRSIGQMDCFLVHLYKNRLCYAQKALKELLPTT